MAVSPRDLPFVRPASTASTFVMAMHDDDLDLLRVGFAEGPQPDTTEMTFVGLATEQMVETIRGIVAQGLVLPSDELPTPSMPRSPDGSVWWDGVNWNPYGTIGGGSSSW